MTDRQAEQATQEQVRALVMADVRHLTAVITATNRSPCADCGAACWLPCYEWCPHPKEAPMTRQLSIIVHLDLPGGEWPDDHTIAREVAEVLDKGGFTVADAEPCPPLRIVPVIGEAT